MVEGSPSADDSLAMNSPDGADAMTSTTANGGMVARSTSKSSTTTQNGSSNSAFPPPRSDKPRPHVCATCTRSFARLEHLKRHERSHTKEKPFECPECSRCFARRDLLLRHQQKLHSTTTPSSRPRSGRRESAAGVNTGRVRKNSVANNSTSGMRPRANTLSHVDSGTLGMLASSNPSGGRNFQPGHGHQNNVTGLPGVNSFEYRGMSTGHHGLPHGLPKLDTSNLSDLSGGLRTAPAYGGFGAQLGMTAPGLGHGGNTINPNAIHLNDLHGLGIEGPSSPFHNGFSSMSASQTMNEEEGNFDWMAHGFENQMSFAQPNESAIETSSPSAMSTNSPSGISEVMLDSTGTMLQNISTTNASLWTNSMVAQAQMMASPHMLEFSQSTFNEMLPAPPGTISPKSLLAQNNAGFDMGFSTPPPLSAMDPPSIIPGYGAPSFHLPLGRNGGGASTASTSSVDSSLRQSSITTASSEVINEQVRGALIAGLAQSSGFSHRKYSQPAISSPLSPGFGSRSKNFTISSFPSTQDLQRYLSAYVRYFHPHLPFLHVSSLSFESPEYTTPLRTINGHAQFGQSSISGGGGCLILAITAIGALYEHDMATSKELFESAKKLISNYLEERRKANVIKAQFGQVHSSEVEDTPLWLVQAMLLNVIYGHNCGDKAAAERASTHCATLVSLARGAELARPYPGYMVMHGLGNSVAHQDMHMGGMGADGWNSIITEPDDSDWHEWRIMEERKRTLYAVFVLSSLLVSAYNHAPALTNSEIRLDLPCDEELWGAESAQAWRAMGGAAVAESRSVTFGAALGHLLTAAQRQQRQSNGSNRSFVPGKRIEDLPERELKPSTFGCLILVNALHNYIWETRQRHLGRQWTIQETEQMHAHIEPALRAWQAAWASNPNHSLERPNPFGAGPLSADSIPLLDLAYVRLFVNLGPSKEAFWQRDFVAMAEELAKGAETVPPLEHSPSSRSEGSHSSEASPGSNSRSDSAGEAASPELDLTRVPSHEDSDLTPDPVAMQKIGQPSRRERYLRKAAFYAADSLSMSDKLGLSFAEHTSRELPFQSAMCAFDCAQVLAEWVTAVQERVGPYLGVIGRDEVDYQRHPGSMLFEDEDRKLLEKIHEVLCSAQQQMSNGSSGLAVSNEAGYGNTILLTTAHMLERAAVWPVTRLMARSLETQAAHMKDRAHGSVVKGG